MVFGWLHLTSCMWQGQKRLFPIGNLYRYKSLGATVTVWGIGFLTKPFTAALLQLMYAAIVLEAECTNSLSCFSSAGQGWLH